MMVRRALFVLVLVGAAFAGGAAINGPGLAWLHRTFAGGPTIIVDAPPAPTPAPAAKKVPPGQFPTAKTPTLQVDLAEAAHPKKKPAAPAPEAGPDLPPESPSTPAAALTRIPGAPTPAPEPLPTPSIAQGPPPAPMPASALPGSDPLAGLDPGPSPKTDAVARLASAERPAPPADAPAASPSPSPSRDWGDLRRRMRTLGIARYSIEAETEGHVKFSCVIPVDGLRAVGHHFETEGDDEYQAVEAALKRVALWRATSSPQD